MRLTQAPGGASILKSSANYLLTSKKTSLLPADMTPQKKGISSKKGNSTRIGWVREPKAFIEISSGAETHKRDGRTQNKNDCNKKGQKALDYTKRQQELAVTDPEIKESN